ncbi:hypothetical protein Q3G72_016204 [Acer saccharum]|nr:hypothetical protein Q3G72_016204 [Acer saccharum]
MRFIRNGTLYRIINERFKTNSIGYGHIYNTDIGPKRVGVSIFSLDMETVRPFGLVLGYPQYLGKRNIGVSEHRTTYIDELVSSTDEVILLLLYTEVDESRTTYSLDMAHALANQFKKGKECLTVTNDFIRALKNGKNPYRNPLSQDIREGDYPFGTPLTHRLYYNEYGFDYNEDDHKDMVSACFIGEFVMTANPKVVALTVNNVRTLNARLQELKKLKVHFYSILLKQKNVKANILV